jgi:hypothetical protein
VNRVVLFAVTVLSLAGCAATDSPGGQPSATSVSTGLAAPAATATVTGTPSPSTTGDVTPGVWQLRYLLLHHYPAFAYCDPDLYPVARADEPSAADGWWTSTNHHSPEVQAIIDQHGYHEPLTAEQRLSAYRDHKKLTVITMTAVAGGYEYQLSTTTTSGGQPDQTVTGVITIDGAIHERARRPRLGGCPICLEAGTRIATPGGDRPLVLIRPGDTVWTTDTTGHRVTSPVERVVRRATSGPHLMLQLALSDGRVLVAAGAHPAADGTYLRQLHAGQLYDGATIASIGWTPSTAPATYDILPAGPTGTYWANGILVGSTLNQIRPVADHRHHDTEPPARDDRQAPTHPPDSSSSRVRVRYARAVSGAFT